MGELGGRKGALGGKKGALGGRRGALTVLLPSQHFRKALINRALERTGQTSGAQLSAPLQVSLAQRRPARPWQKGLSARLRQHLIRSLVAGDLKEVGGAAHGISGFVSRENLNSCAREYKKYKYFCVAADGSREIHRYFCAAAHGS